MIQHLAPVIKYLRTSTVFHALYVMVNFSWKKLTNIVKIKQFYRLRAGHICFSETIVNKCLLWLVLSWKFSSSKKTNLYIYILFVVCTEVKVFAWSICILKAMKRRAVNCRTKIPEAQTFKIWIVPYSQKSTINVIMN